MWETYTAWGRKFDSDIIHLNLVGQSVVVLLSSTATDDLLEKRSAIYSDRPSLPMYVDIVGWDFNLVVMKYGNKWRAHRRLFSQAFNSVGSKRFRPKQLAATRRMLCRFLATPNEFNKHIRQMAGELIINVAYGIDVLPVDDPYVALAEEGIQAGTGAAIPGKFLVVSAVLEHVPRPILLQTRAIFARRKAESTRQRSTGYLWLWKKDLSGSIYRSFLRFHLSGIYPGFVRHHQGYRGRRSAD
ncbi:cytochrome P450 [Mycena metata]|uniref:Cytochrome P450 n=1 Tax=Mycena metata TaxID=1033252 RepID=A0AAD7MKS8_9AGAR|nr:cytochrome P450 [Mycena metata]